MIPVAENIKDLLTEDEVMFIMVLLGLGLDLPSVFLPLFLGILGIHSQWNKRSYSCI